MPCFIGAINKRRNQQQTRATPQQSRKSYHSPNSNWSLKGAAGVVGGMFVLVGLENEPAQRDEDVTHGRGRKRVASFAAQTSTKPRHTTFSTSTGAMPRFASSPDSTCSSSSDDDRTVVALCYAQACRSARDPVERHKLFLQALMPSSDIPRSRKPYSADPVEERKARNQEASARNRQRWEAYDRRLAIAIQFLENRVTSDNGEDLEEVASHHEASAERLSLLCRGVMMIPLVLSLAFPTTTGSQRRQPATMQSPRGPTFQTSPILASTFPCLIPHSLPDSPSLTASPGSSPTTMAPSSVT